MSAYGSGTGPEYLDEPAAATSTQTCDCGLDLDEFGDHRPAADACETCGHRLDYCVHAEPHGNDPYCDDPTCPSCGRDAALDAAERIDA